MANQEYRLNHRIRVPEVRLIDQNGEQCGVVSTNEAKRLAQDAGLDLVEVSPNARPPVCKIMDFGKFKYQQRKKDKKGGKKSSSGMKELRVRPAISDHDLSYRLKDGRRFLEEGHKIQVVCLFKGRQMAHPEHGYEVMRQVASKLEDLSKVEVPARMAGRRMTMMLTALTADQRRSKAKELEERAKQEALEKEMGAAPAARMGRTIVAEPVAMTDAPVAGTTGAASPEPTPDPTSESTSESTSDVGPQDA